MHRGAAPRWFIDPSHVARPLQPRSQKWPLVPCMQIHIHIHIHIPIDAAPPHVGRLTRAPPKNAQRQVQSSAADLWTRGPTGRRALRSALGALPFSLSSGPKLPPALMDEVSCSLPCPALPGLCLAERTPAARGDWQGHSLALGRSRRNDGTGGVLDERDGLLVRRAHSVSAGPQVRPGPARPLVPGTALNRQRDHLRYRY